MTGIWKPVVGFEGKYEVSSLGRVRSLRKLLSPYTTNYKYVFLGAKNRRSVHRLVCEAFHGDPQGREVNHIDSNPYNNRADNLEWVTRSGNRQHTARSGNHNRARLTPEQVLRIREQLAEGCGVVALAKAYSVSRHAISNIKAKRTWGFL